MCFTCTKFLALLTLVVQIAEKIRCKCVHLQNDMNTFDQFIQQIGYNWLYWFESKYFKFFEIWIKLFI